MKPEEIPKPQLRIEFTHLPSYNDLLAVSRRPFAVNAMIQKWRKEARAKAIFYAERQGFNIKRWTEHGVSEKGRETKTKHELIDPFCFSGGLPITVILRYWRPTNRDYDVFNPLIKPIFDGFVDAGVVPDDSQKYIPEYIARFEGVDTSLKLSKEAQEERKIERKTKGKNKLLTPARFWFDFVTDETETAVLFS